MCEVHLHIMVRSPSVVVTSGQPLTTALAHSAVDTPQVSICTRWPKSRSDTHARTHTAYQHSPSAGVSGSTLEELTCDPELLLSRSHFPIPRVFPLSRCLFPPLLWLSVHDGQIRGCNPSATRHMARPCCHRCSDWTLMLSWWRHVVRNQSATSEDGRSTHC